MKPPRISVGGLFHEGYSFNSLLTDRENYMVTIGKELVRKTRRSAQYLKERFKHLKVPDSILNIFQLFTLFDFVPKSIIAN